MYIKNYEHPSNMAIALPFAFVWSTVWSIIFIVYSPSSWFLIPAIGLGLPLFFSALVYDGVPIDAAIDNYLGYLTQFSVTDLVVAVNDPNRPAYTKNLIRRFLNEEHAGWHQRMTVV